MAAPVLVSLGAQQEGGVPTSLQPLFDEGVFEEVVCLTAMPSDPNRYWLDVIAALPRSVDTALIVPRGVDVTRDLLRLGSMLNEGTAAVFPLSMQHEVARPLMKAGESLTLSADDMNTWLNRYAVGTPVEVPVLAGYCAWLNVAQLRHITASTDHELSLSLRQAGHSILLSDEAFVDDTVLGMPSRLGQDLPESIVVALTDRHPYTALRHPLSELNAAQQAPPQTLARGASTILHISHSWGGGLSRWISDFCAADEQHTHLILKSIGTRKAGAQALALYLGSGPMPLKQWSLTTPIQSTSLGSHEYRAILAEITGSFSVRALVVSTLIGHSLDVYDAGLPVVQVLHDYYPWCPPLYATWDAPCTHCDADKLSRCLPVNPAHRFFGDERAEWYLTLRDRFMEKLSDPAVVVVAPTESVKRRWQQLAPGLAACPVSIIGHGLPTEELEKFADHRWQATQEQRLHLVVLGMLSDHKGGKQLSQILPALLQHYDITLLGTGEDAPSFTQHSGLTVIKHYRLPDLPALLKDIKPDIGLLQSTVPETFSYTLSELFAAGIPPVATNLGAFADRIEPGVTGWLVSPAPASDEVVARLTALAQDRDKVRAVRDTLLSGDQRSASDMVADYLALLPAASPLKVRRPLCRSVVAETGVRLDQGEPSQKALFVRPGARYKLALSQFMLYSYQKCQDSPQLPRVAKKMMGWLLRVAMRVSRP